MIDRIAGDTSQLDDVWRREVELSDRLGFPMGYKPHPTLGQFQLSFLVRMLFSGLVDADFLDTEAYYDRIESRDARHAREYPSLAALRECLDARLAQFWADTEVNQLRANILRQVRQGAEQATRPVFPDSTRLWRSGRARGARVPQRLRGRHAAFTRALRCRAKAAGPRWPAALLRMMAWPVVLVTSARTSASWIFICTKAFCMRCTPAAPFGEQHLALAHHGRRRTPDHALKRARYS